MGRPDIKERTAKNLEHKEAEQIILHPLSSKALEGQTAASRGPSFSCSCSQCCSWSSSSSSSSDSDESSARSVEPSMETWCSTASPMPCAWALVALSRASPLPLSCFLSFFIFFSRLRGFARWSFSQKQIIKRGPMGSKAPSVPWVPSSNMHFSTPAPVSAPANVLARTEQLITVLILKACPHFCLVQALTTALLMVTKCPVTRFVGVANRPPAEAPDSTPKAGAKARGVQW
mmetsp:Transcript_60778/g.163653  ORF Transcript_60778/g.163653 Transcript_60778/m.163653 type:complete len:232 (-) Transcript_60778:79-774(-)